MCEMFWSYRDTNVHGDKREEWTEIDGNMQQKEKKKKTRRIRFSFELSLTFWYIMLTF